MSCIFILPSCILVCVCTQKHLVCKMYLKKWVVIFSHPPLTHVCTPMHTSRHNLHVGVPVCACVLKPTAMATFLGSCHYSFRVLKVFFWNNSFWHKDKMWKTNLSALFCESHEVFQCACFYDYGIAFDVYFTSSLK